MEGEIIEDEQAVHQEAIRYFKNVLRRAQRVRRRQIHMRRTLTSEQCTEMCREITVEEIKAAMFSINSMKAPGPDGYSASFFKNNWKVVGSEVTEAIMSFFAKGKLLKAWNSTVVSLIPKIDVPCTMKDF